MKIRKALFTAGALFALYAVVYAQAVFTDVQKFSTENADVQVKHVVGDGQGNIYFTGIYSSATLKLSADITLINNGTNDIFLAKSNENGQIEWAISMGSEKSDAAEDMAINSLGEIFICGVFWDNSFKIGDSTFTKSSPINSFLLKLSPDGTIDWLETSKNSNMWNSATCVFTDSGNNAWMAGSFYGKIEFGSDAYTPNGDKMNIFMLKYDNSGNLLWSNFLEGEDDLGVQDIAVDNARNVIITGNKNGSYDGNLICYKILQNKSVAWSITDTLLTEGVQVEVNSANEIILLSKLVPEWGISLCATDYRPTNSSALQKFNSNGQHVWTDTLSGAYGQQFVVDGNGKIFVTASLYADSIQFGDEKFYRKADSSNTCAYYPDILLLEYNSDGSTAMMKGVSGYLDDQPTDIFLLDNNELIISGIYESYQMDFDQHTLFNEHPVDIFGHVSGIYYNRLINSFIGKFCLSNCTVDVPEFPDHNRVTIFPNPVRSGQPFTLQGMENLNNASAFLYSLSGTLIDQQLINTNTLSYAVKDGIYILNIKTNKGNVVIKLVVTSR